jgi:hypothetical protein
MADGDTDNVGSKIILPPTHVGSPRYFRDCFQSGMALTREFGKPDYFLTMTTNPNWPEIKEALFEGEHPHDRPDLVARVFKQKYDSLMDDILKKHLLGKVIAHVAAVEWQKRGLPHVHILLFMASRDKPRSPEAIDKAVCAEIPDKEVNPELYNIIVKHNMHGPCGHYNTNSPCMAGEPLKCNKKIPKKMQKQHVHPGRRVSRIPQKITS